MRMPLLRLPIFAVCALAITSELTRCAAPQAAPDRIRVRGEARTLDSKPWVQAKITLQSEPEFDLPEAGPRDSIHCESDAAGRFRANLLPGRSYTAYAFDEAGGVVRRSRLERDIVPGRTIRLVEAVAQTRKLRALLYGLTPWRKRGPLVAQLVDEAGNRFDIAVGDDAEVAALDLPVVAGERGRLVVAAGATGLVATDIEFVHEVRERAALARVADFERLDQSDRVPGLPHPDAAQVRDPDVELCFVGPPACLDLRVVDAAGPVAKASIDVVEDENGSVSRRATTDDGGFATLVLPTPVDGLGRPDSARTLDLQAVSPRHELAPRLIEVATWLRPVDDADAKHEHYEVRLVPGTRAELRIEDAAGKPIAGAPLLVLMGHSVARARQRELALRLLLLRSDDNGHAHITGLGERSFVTNLARLEAADASTTHLRRVALDVDCAALSSKKGIVHARPRGVMRDLRVIDADGSPAPNARIEVVENGTQWYENSLFRVRYLTDRRGRVRIQDLGGSVAALSEQGFGHARSQDLFAFEEAELTLIPLAHRSCRLVEADGSPVVGARLRLALDSGTMADEVERALGGLPRAWNLERIDVMTNTNGHFDLRWISWQGQDLTLRIEHGDLRQRKRLVLNDAAPELELRIDRR